MTQSPPCPQCEFENHEDCYAENLDPLLFDNPQTHCLCMAQNHELKSLNYRKIVK